jgi:phosphohistidine phosphatase SixA
MIVGHSPIISELVEYLTNQEIGNMSPASVAILEFDSLSWNEISQGTGKLNMLVSPDSL